MRRKVCKRKEEEDVMCINHPLPLLFLGLWSILKVVVITKNFTSNPFIAISTFISFQILLHYLTSPSSFSIPQFTDTSCSAPAPPHI